MEREERSVVNLNWPRGGGRKIKTILMGFIINEEHERDRGVEGGDQ